MHKRIRKFEGSFLKNMSEQEIGSTCKTAIGLFCLVKAAEKKMSLFPKKIKDHFSTKTCFLLRIQKSKK